MTERLTPSRSKSVRDSSRIDRFKSVLNGDFELVKQFMTEGNVNDKFVRVKTGL